MEQHQSGSGPAAAKHHSNIPDFWEISCFLRRQPVAQALERLPFPASVTDENDVFLYVNEALCENYRYTARQLIGMTRRLLLPINFAEDLRAMRRRLCAGTAGAVIETIGSDGRRQRISMRIVPVGVRLGVGLDVQTVYLGVCCPVGSETQRDLALLTTPWSQLAGMMDNVESCGAVGGGPDVGPHLSQREAQIKMLDLVGCDTKRIAHVLGISDSTVRVLRARGRHKSESHAPFPSNEPPAENT